MCTGVLFWACALKPCWLLGSSLAPHSSAFYCVLSFLVVVYKLDALSTVKVSSAQNLFFFLMDQNTEGESPLKRDDAVFKFPRAGIWRRNRHGTHSTLKPPFSFSCDQSTDLSLIELYRGLFGAQASWSGSKQGISICCFTAVSQLPAYRYRLTPNSCLPTLPALLCKYLCIHA